MFIEVYKDNKKQWRWRLKAGNGRILADGVRGGANQHACKVAAGSAIAGMATAPNAFEPFKDSAGGWRWRYTGKTRIIAESSESYVKKSNVKRIIYKIVRGIDSNPGQLELRVVE